MRRNVFALSIAISAFLGSAAFAHHSYASFDQARTINVAGVVKEFQWKNPHVVVVLSVTDGRSKKVVDWTLEGPSPNGLRRVGWSGTMMKAGDRVTLKINPMRNGAPGGSLIGVTVGGRTYLKED